MEPCADRGTEKAGQEVEAAWHLKVYKTTVFKIHNPSQRKRAMLTDSMKRAHLACTRLLGHLLTEVERFAAMTKKERNAEMQGHIPLSPAAAARARSKLGHPYRHPRADQRLHRVAQVTGRGADAHGKQAERGGGWLRGGARGAGESGSDLARENTLRDEVACLARSPHLRPISYYGNTRGFISSDGRRRRPHYVWLNLHPRTSRYAQAVKVENLVDMRTGEVIHFTSTTGAVFPLELA